MFCLFLHFFYKLLYYTYTRMRKRRQWLFLNNDTSKQTISRIVMCSYYKFLELRLELLKYIRSHLKMNSFIFLHNEFDCMSIYATTHWFINVFFFIAIQMTKKNNNHDALSSATSVNNMHPLIFFELFYVALCCMENIPAWFSFEINVSFVENYTLPIIINLSYLFCS